LQRACNSRVVKAQRTILSTESRSYKFRAVILRPTFASVLFAVGFASLGAGCDPSAHTAKPADDAARIVSLAPSITETLFALGAGSKVVGVSSYCDYPSQVYSLPRVGNFLTPNLEQIIALRPSLIISLVIASNQRQIRALQSMGFPILLVGEESLGDIEHSIEQIGDRTGHARQAQALLARIHAHFRAVSECVADTKWPRVLMLVGHQPMVAVGSGTFLDELLKIAHADNIAEVAGQQWPRLTMEYVVATAPDVIIDGQMGADAATPDSFWARFVTIPAVRNHRVFGYDEDSTLRPGPRVWQSLETMAEMVHPEALKPGSGRARPNAAQQTIGGDS
jgi:iron complex transport system substrate-binding protein